MVCTFCKQYYLIVIVDVLSYLCVGDWKPTQIDNPDYQGEWVHPKIPNPEYEADEFLYRYEDFGVIGLDLWQVRDGSLSLSPFSFSSLTRLFQTIQSLVYAGQIWHHF